MKNLNILLKTLNEDVNIFKKWWSMFVVICYLCVFHLNFGFRINIRILWLLKSQCQYRFSKYHFRMLLIFEGKKNRSSNVCCNWLFLCFAANFSISIKQSSFFITAGTVWIHIFKISISHFTKFPLELLRKLEVYILTQKHLQEFSFKTKYWIFSILDKVQLILVGFILSIFNAAKYSRHLPLNILERWGKISSTN